MSRGYDEVQRLRDTMVALKDGRWSCPGSTVVEMPFEATVEAFDKLFKTNEMLRDDNERLQKRLEDALMPGVVE